MRCRVVERRGANAFSEYRNIRQTKEANVSRPRTDVHKGIHALGSGWNAELCHDGGAGFWAQHHREIVVGVRCSTAQ